MSQDRKRLLFCLLASYLLGLTAHGFAFLNAFFSHDSLNAIYASGTEERWKIALGRFVVPLYRRLFRGSLAVPWLIGLLALLFAGLAVYLVVRMFRLRSGWLIALTAGIMTTNVALIAQTATYLYELDFNMLELLLAVAAAWLWQRDRLSLTLTVGSLLIALSMGIYQSYASVAVVLILSISVISLLEGRGWKRTLAAGLRGATMLILGMIVYLALRQAACAILQVPLEAQVSPMNNLSVSRLARLVSDTYLWFHRAPLTAYPSVVGKSVKVCAIAAGAAVMLYTLLRSRKLCLPDALLLVVLVALLPFGSCAIYILTGGVVHDLMIYAAWMVYALPCLLAEWFARQSAPARLKTAVKALCALMASMMIWQNVGIANTVYLKKELEYQAELSAMTRVIADMEAQEGYVPGETPVAFYGTRGFVEKSPLPMRIRSITGTGYHTSITMDRQAWFFDLYRAYFTHVLNYPVNWCAPEERQRLQATDDFAAMPAYPAQGYVRMIDGVLVVRMR